MTRLRLSPLMALMILALTAFDGLLAWAAVRGWDSRFDPAAGAGHAQSFRDWEPPGLIPATPPRAKPLAAYPQILARPVFTRTRRPFEATAAIQAPARIGVPDAPTQPASDPTIRLAGVSLRGDRQRALIIGREGTDGRWVAPGDTVEGWTVATIEANTLTFAHGARRFTVRLYPGLPARADGSDPRGER